MKRLTIALSAAGLVAAASAAQSAELRIGFISTLTGGAAIIGKQQVNGLMLGLEHQGWRKNGDKLGGVPMKLYIGDDQRKPDVGLRVANKMIKSDKVQIVAGIIWSNILMAVQRPVIRAKRILLITNAGAAPMAGRKCSRYFITTSFQNDTNSEASGQLLNEEGLKSVYLLSPNYQAGKDVLRGFRRRYKGKVVGQTLFKLGQRDYQADISKIRAAKPQALFVFAPGGMGIAFMKQWAASGAGKKIKLFTVFVVDHMTLRPIGTAALNTFHTNHWDQDSKNPRNRKMLAGYVAKHKGMPSHFAIQSYDAAELIARGVRAVKGNVNNTLAMVKAMRDDGLHSVRGHIKYNVNGFVIQSHYKRIVALGAGGRPTIRTVGVVTSDHRDTYWRKCPARERH